MVCLLGSFSDSHQFCVKLPTKNTVVVFSCKFEFICAEMNRGGTIRMFLSLRNQVEITRLIDRKVRGSWRSGLTRQTQATKASLGNEWLCEFWSTMWAPVRTRPSLTFFFCARSRQRRSGDVHGSNAPLSIPKLVPIAQIRRFPCAAVCRSFRETHFYYDRIRLFSFSFARTRSATRRRSMRANRVETRHPSSRLFGHILS